MNEIFNGCSCLIEIPDISKWDINKEVTINSINNSASYSNYLKNESIINTSLNSKYLSGKEDNKQNNYNNSEKEDYEPLNASDENNYYDYFYN